MLTFDVAMPLMLFALTITALLLSKRMEGRLKSTLEDREFKPRDTILFVVLIAVAVSVVVFIPELALIALFLFSYSSLLFTFSYLFSGLSKKRIALLESVFAVVSLVVGIVALFGPFVGASVFYAGIAAFGLAVFCFAVVLVEFRKVVSGGRWYFAVLPPALFIVVFFVFSSTSVWFPVLFDVFGVVFAVLITLYLSELFTWRTTFIFAGFLTAVDFVLVLVFPVTAPAAEHIVSLGLPVLIALPIIPPVFISGGLWGLAPIGLGLGDFFFAGTLATQTLKKFGKQTAVVSALTMSVTFGVFEILLLNTDLNAFPGTLMIILGWLPVVALKMFSERKNKNVVNVEG